MDTWPSKAGVQDTSHLSSILDRSPSRTFSTLTLSAPLAGRLLCARQVAQHITLFIIESGSSVLFLYQNHLSVHFALSTVLCHLPSHSSPLTFTRRALCSQGKRACPLERPKSPMQSCHLLRQPPRPSSVPLQSHTACLARPP